MRIDGEKLQEARKAKGFSTTQLAAKVDVSERTIERYEGNGANLNIHLARAIASACGVKVETLTKGE